MVPPVKKFTRNRIIVNQKRSFVNDEANMQAMVDTNATSMVYKLTSAFNRHCSSELTIFLP